MRTSRARPLTWPLLWVAAAAHQIGYLGPSYFHSEWIAPSLKPLLPPPPASYDRTFVNAILEQRCKFANHPAYPTAVNDASMVTVGGAAVCAPLMAWDRIVQVDDRRVLHMKVPYNAGFGIGSNVTVERWIPRSTPSRPETLAVELAAIGRSLLVLNGQLKSFRRGFESISRNLFTPNAGVQWHVMAFTDPFEFCTFRDPPAACATVEKPAPEQIKATLTELYGDQLVYIQLARCAHSMARLAGAWRRPLHTVAHRYDHLVVLRFDVAFTAPLLLRSLQCESPSPQGVVSRLVGWLVGWLVNGTAGVAPPPQTSRSTTFLAISAGGAPTNHPPPPFHNRDIDFGSVTCTPTSLRHWVAPFLKPNFTCSASCPLHPPKAFNGKGVSCDLLPHYPDICGAMVAFRHHAVEFGNLDPLNVFLTILRPHA